MKNIKAFIYREFFIKQVAWLLTSLTVLFVILNAVQLRSSITATKDKIDTMLELNQSEIFSSIVLQDFQSLEDHLELIKKQNQFDYIVLIVNGKKVETINSNVSPFYRWIKLFKPKYSKLIQNEFETVGFNFEAHFSNSIITDHFIPYLRMSLIMFLTLVGVLYVFVRKQINRVQTDIVGPLTDIVNKLQNDDLESENKEFYLNELNILYQAIRTYPKLKKDSTIAEISSQVAHDIRSPLEALKSAKEEIARLPELERESINLAINRIEEIAYQLLMMRKKSVKVVAGKTHVKSMIYQIIQEKKLQYRDNKNLSILFDSDADSFETFSSLDSETLKRILSNLISNAVEAMKFEGEVYVGLANGHNSFKISVADNGPELSEEQKKRVFEKGFTTKDKGNGLGLYYARKDIESSDGHIQLIREDKTTVEINLPRVDIPKTFASKIDLKGIKNVIILDDDESIHQVWKIKFRNINVKLEHFYKASDLLQQYSFLPENSFFLSDYELLGEDINGIGCINLFKGHDRSILVTARADELHIIKQCEQHGIKLLPKSMANEVDIRLDSANRKVVLIDDDKLTHMNWKLNAKKSNVELEVYYTIEDFLKDADHHPKEISIYVDSNLGNGVKGEVHSKKIFDIGFEEIFLATGMESQDINKPHWIKSIRGKDFPSDTSYHSAKNLLIP